MSAEWVQLFREDEAWFQYLAHPTAFTCRTEGLDVPSCFEVQMKADIETLEGASITFPHPLPETIRQALVEGRRCHLVLTLEPQAPE